jgi:hypothetical protein
VRPQKRKVQTRQSRSARMRSATVKRALATNADLVKPGVGYRRGLHPVDPTPATDTLLFDETARHLRRAAVEVVCLVGGMALVSAVVVYLGRSPQTALAPSPGTFGLAPGLVNVLIVIAAFTGVLALVVVVRRWQQGRKALTRLSRDERRCTLAAGSLQVQERETEVGSRVHWLRPDGGDWMLVEEAVFDALEPSLVEAPTGEVAFDRRTGSDVVQAWTIPNASILFHPGAPTVIEIHDSTGDLVYRHPRYRPRT